MMNNGKNAAQKLATILIVILLSSGSLGLIFTTAFAKGDGDFPPPDPGDWVITSPTNVTNEILYMNGNILVKNGGILHLESVTLIFNSTHDGEFKIDVENGGTLYLYNSTVDRGTDYTYGFRLLDGGKLRVENSEIRRCGFNAWNFYGLTLYGDNAIIKNTLFTQGHIGIYSYIATGHEIIGNSFINNTHVAVYLHTVTDFLISENLMDHNNYGTYLHASGDGIVEKNTVRNNTGMAAAQGIMAIKSDNIEIRDNHVDGTVEALYAHTSSNITFRDNTATNSTRGIRIHDSDYVDSIGNDLWLNIHGMHIVQGNNLLIRDNNVSFNRDYNIYAYRDTNVLIENNIFNNVTVYYGVALRECSEIEVNDCIFLGNADRALWLWDSNNITMYRNVISDTNLGYYNLRSVDTLFADGEISRTNYGIWFDGSIRNIVENSTALGSNTFDIHLRGTTTDLTLLNTDVDTKDFHDEQSEYIEQFYLEVEVQGRTGPVSGVDVEVVEILTGNVIYSTPAFGGADHLTDDAGKVSWIRPLFASYNKNGSTQSQVRIQINDHGIFQDEWYGYVEHQKTVTFTKSALTVDQAGNGDYTTIGEAIAAASDGDSILVSAGVYQENLIIDKSLEIYGKGGVVSIDASGATGFDIQANTTLGNFTITNASLDFDIQADTFVFNVTFATVNFDASHYLYVGYYVTIHTVDDDQQPIPRANVTVDSAFFPLRTCESDPNGLVKHIPLTDYADSTSEHLEFNPYVVNGSRTFRSGSTELTIHNNMDLILNLTRHGEFGSSVTNGDFNNDGYTDYAVGAPFDDQGAEDAGAVFIYYGPQKGVEELRPIDADIVLNGERIHSWYGTTLANADVNGDGIDDLIVGSPGYNSTGANGLMGWYWNEDDFRDFQYARVDQQINFGNGQFDPPQVGNSFSVNWSGYLYVTVEDDYTFYFDHDDGVRMYLNNQLILEAWEHTGQEAQSQEPLHLTPGYYPIGIEFYDSGGPGSCVMKWETPEMEKQVITSEHLFYTMDINPGKGAVYIYSGELFDGDDITAASGIRQDGAFPLYGNYLSAGDSDIDGKHDILVGFEGGTQLLFGNIMLYHEEFNDQPMLSGEWDPLTSGGGGEMYLSGDGMLTIDTESDSDAYAYVMSRDILDRGIGFSMTLQRGASTMVITGIDYKVPREDVSDLGKQEDHTLFSLYANGQIKYWPTFGGNVRIENPNVDNRPQFTFSLLITPEYDHLWVYLDGEELVDTPLTGWDPVYLKMGDSTHFGMAVINIMEYSPLLLNATIPGWEHAVILNNTERKIAASVDGDVYLFSINLDDLFVNSSDSRTDFSGIHNYTTFKNGITLSPFYFIPIVANGDFNDGWDNWTQAENVRGTNNAEWELTTEEHGDWTVYDGPAGSFGPDRDNVASGQGQGRDCDGTLVSDPFYVPEDVKYLDLWHHTKWWSMERANENQYQDEIADAVNFRVIDNETGLVVAELLYSQDAGYPVSGEEDGRLSLDISGQTGKWLRLEVEIVTNYRQYDDALVQIDNVTGAKENDDLAGDFTSRLMELNRTFTAFVVNWQGDDHDGNITFYYRLEKSEDWILLPDGLVDLGTDATTFQYKIEFQAVKGNPYPIIESLHFSFYNGTPEYLRSGWSADVGTLLEEHTLGIVDGSTLTLYQGSSPKMTITADHDIQAVSSTGDVDINGEDDIIVTSDGTAYLFLSDGIGDRTVGDADYSFAGESGYGASLHRTLIGSPDELAADGRAYVLPMVEENIALVSVNLEDKSLIYPHTSKTLKPVVKNTGLQRLENVGLRLEITAPSYSHEETIQVSLDPGEAVEVPFVWVIPEDEWVTYTIVFSLDSDQNDQDNTIEIEVTTRYHALTLETTKDYDAVSENGLASYRLVLGNIGTLGEDNVTFQMDLPNEWDWWTSRSGVNITYLLIEDHLSFNLYMQTSSSVGVYPVTLTAVSENGTAKAVMDLEVHIVDRDITPILVTYLRENGKEGTPISGENTTIVLTLMNPGTETVAAFNTTLYLDDEQIRIGDSLGIAANDTTTISFHVILQEGSHTLRFVVDEFDAIREYNEMNNEIISEVEVKPEISSAPFLFRVHVVDLEGANFTGAKIRVSSGSNIFENVTDDFGMSLLMVQSFPEGEVYLVEAISGELYASVTIAAYSEDVEAVVEMVVGRYSFLFTCDSRDKEIAPGGVQSYAVNITNTGDFGDNFTITLDGLPENWDADITGNGYDEGMLELGKDIKTTLTITLTSWEYAPAYQRYELTLATASLISPASSSDMILRATVTINENITMTTEKPVEHGLPRDPISHRVFVTNFGNTQRNITFKVTGDAEYVSLSRYFITLDPGESEEILFVIIIPNMRAGSVLNQELYGIISGVGTTPSIEFTTTIDATSGQYMEAAILGRTLVITNNGNTDDHISILADTPLANIILLPSSVDIDMGETVEVQMDVEMIDLNIPAGSFISVYLSLFNGNIYFINATRNMLVPEVYALSLETEDSPLQAPPGTQASFEVLVTNLGNVDLQIFFTGTIDGNEPLRIPAPIILNRHQEVYVYPMVTISEEASGQREISFTAMSGDEDLEVTLDLELDLSVVQDIELQEISARAYEGGTRYTINLVNSGEIQELVRIETNCGELDLETAEIPVDDYIQFHLLITEFQICPGTIVINATSDNGQGVSYTLELIPPPFVTIEIKSTIPATVSDPVILEASGDYSSYLWTIDEKNVLGRKIYYNFTSSGLHQIELTVRDNRDISSRFFIDILVENQPPVIEVAPTLFGNAGEYFDFDARESYDPDGSIVEFRWVIENESYIGPNIHHIFPTGGSYTISLQVTDNDGMVATTDVLVTVRETEDKQEGTVEKEELDMQLVGISSALLLALIGTIAFLYFHLNQEESTMLQKLNSLESMRIRGAPEVVAEVVSGADGRSCPTCGHHVPANFKFCNKCGVHFDEIRGDHSVSLKTTFCTDCGHQVPENFKFCNKCGSPIDHEEVAS